MYVAVYLGLLRTAERELADALTLMADRHSREPELRDTAPLLAGWSRKHLEEMAPLVERYGATESEHPQKLRAALLGGTRIGGMGYLWDLQDLELLISQVRSSWQVLQQTAKALQDGELIALTKAACQDVERQYHWVRTLIKTNASQAVGVMAEPASEVSASLPEYPSIAAIPDPVWGPLAAGTLMLVVGGMGLLAGQPWLLPSLGPTAYLQAVQPAHPSASWLNTIFGHLTGLASGFVAVALLNAWDAPVVLTDKELVPVRVLAAIIALALTLLVTQLIRASHPPAGATTLLVALGSLKTSQDALNVVIGVVIIALAGELLRRLRLGQALSRLPDKPKAPKGAYR